MAEQKKKAMKKPKIEQYTADRMLAYQFAVARTSKRITQKELAEITGIYQGDISKLEHGLGNPSIATLQRLANGLGMEVEVRLVPKQEKTAEEK